MNVTAAHLKIAQYAAVKYSYLAPGCDYDDLRSIANMACAKFAQKYNSAIGGSVKNYLFKTTKNCLMSQGRVWGSGPLALTEKRRYEVADLENEIDERSVENHIAYSRRPNYEALCDAKRVDDLMRNSLPSWQYKLIMLCTVFDWHLTECEEELGLHFKTGPFWRRKIVKRIQAEVLGKEPPKAKNRRFNGKEKTAIRDYHKKERSYKKTMEEFGITSKGTLCHILKSGP